ncbi:hypothetical protein NDU88_002662 [Pleurodeles waltl]|uniref:Uncharacterized protein n=1 Tax=Pleurodeles waltl TaxID=8319 RepID=A0AAV7M339_PLEWA|nr:hypothetical protein NDU88_002662 [Pleurodeles waltl]
MSSAEVRALRLGAADAPRGRCGDTGFAPTGVPVPGEQSPGPSVMQRETRAPYTEAAMREEGLPLFNAALPGASLAINRGTRRDVFPLFRLIWSDKTLSIAIRMLFFIIVHYF